MVIEICYDWEFDTETNPDVIEPISLGMVDDRDREVYLINKDFDWDNCKSQWLKDNVLPQLKLPGIPYIEVSKDGFSRQIERWLLPHVHELKEGERLRLIGYYADYDHVCLCQRFGGMMNLPSYMPMWTYDIKQWCEDLGGVRLPEQGKGEHHALLDARWIRDSKNELYANHPS